MVKQQRMVEVRQAVGAVTVGAAPCTGAAKAHLMAAVVDIRGRFSGGAAVVAGKEGAVVGSYCRRGEGRGAAQARRRGQRKGSSLDCI